MTNLRHIATVLCDFSWNKFEFISIPGILKLRTPELLNNSELILKLISNNIFYIKKINPKEYVNLTFDENIYFLVGVYCAKENHDKLISTNYINNILIN